VLWHWWSQKHLRISILYRRHYIHMIIEEAIDRHSINLWSWVCRSITRYESCNLAKKTVAGVKKPTTWINWGLSWQQVGYRVSQELGTSWKEQAHWCEVPFNLRIYKGRWSASCLCAEQWLSCRYFHKVFVEVIIWELQVDTRDNESSRLEFMGGCWKL
jgi:hypothetical protein